MNPKQLHQEAMQFSFLAKQAFEAGEDFKAREYYEKAAGIEGDLAKFYFDKPELEPTRSTIVRSAAFLHLKAGLIDEARQLIFWGLLNLQDEQIKEQLNEALEASMALKNMDRENAGNNVEYLKILRQRSVHYTLEPTHQKFGSVVSLEMVRDFADDYLKSLKAYAVSSFMRVDTRIKKLGKDVDSAAREFENLVSPLLTTLAIGSFKFSIANDFLSRGEDTEIVRLKANMVMNYHERIFINPLDDGEIELLKKEYKEEEINQIFRPITRIKSVNSPYKVAYFDRETFQKKYLPRMASAQRRKLLPPTQVSLEAIGILESTIIHARYLEDGKKSRSLIQKEQLRSLEFDSKTNQIEPKDKRPLLLREEITIPVLFNADKGFTFSFEDLGIQHTDTDYNRGLQGFHAIFYDRVINIVNADPKDTEATAERTVIDRLITNAESLRR